jgi:hypothetical protein
MDLTQLRFPNGWAMADALFAVHESRLNELHSHIIRQNARKKQRGIAYESKNDRQKRSNPH